MQILCHLIFYKRYWSEVHTKHENLFSMSLESEQARQRAIAVHYIRNIYLFTCLFI